MRGGVHIPSGEMGKEEDIFYAWVPRWDLGILGLPVWWRKNLVRYTSILAVLSGSRYADQLRTFIVLISAIRLDIQVL